MVNSGNYREVFEGHGGWYGAIDYGALLSDRGESGIPITWKMHRDMSVHDLVLGDWD